MVVLQDQEAFERRRGRKGVADAALAMPVAPQMAADDSLLGQAIPSDDDMDATPLPEVLHSATATMMAEDARSLLLSGKGSEGLDAYKKRFYRKMDAFDDERVCT
jgi:hypothetical protein